MSWPIYAYDNPIFVPLENETIKGRIYLSGIGWAKDLPTNCQNDGFTHIINFAGSFLRTRHYKSNIFENKDLVYNEIDLTDVPEQRLDIYVNDIYDKIDNYLKTESKILIHCFFGQSRSVSILCYYIMKKYKWNYETTIEYIRKYRSIAQPNSGFENYLKSLKFDN